MVVTLGAASNSTWWPVVGRASPGLINIVALGSVWAAETVMTRLTVDSTNTSYDVTAAENSGSSVPTSSARVFRVASVALGVLLAMLCGTALVMAGALVPVAAVRSGLSPGV